MTNARAKQQQQNIISVRTVVCARIVFLLVKFIRLFIYHIVYEQWTSFTATFIQIDWYAFGSMEYCHG